MLEKNFLFFLSFSVVIITPETQTVPSAPPYNTYNITCKVTGNHLPIDIQWINAENYTPVIPSSNVVIEKSSDGRISILSVTESAPNVYTFYCTALFNGGTIQSSLPMKTTVQVTGKSHNTIIYTWIYCCSNRAISVNIVLFPCQLQLVHLLLPM